MSHNTTSLTSTGSSTSASAFTDKRFSARGRSVDPASRKRIYPIIKRLFDIVVSACALLLTWPLVLLGAIAVKLTSPGPAFYHAQRAGLRGRLFSMYKLRTMRVGTDTVNRRITATHDDRVTPVGNLLRKFKIDELPQLWNVLCGHMAIIGPRPEDWDIVQNHYTPEQRRSLDVRPGLAATADVRWYPDLTYHDPPPAGVPLQEWYLARHLPAQVAEGVSYLERQSLLLDLKVIVQMIFCVLVRSWRPAPPQPLSPVPAFVDHVAGYHGKGRHAQGRRRHAFAKEIS